MIPKNSITDRPKVGAMRWKRNGDSLVLFDGFKYSRAVLMRECDSWLMIGPLGTGLPIKEQSGSNKRTLMRSMEKLLREVGY